MADPFGLILFSASHEDPIRSLFRAKIVSPKGSGRVPNKKANRTAVTALYRDRFWYYLAINHTKIESKRTHNIIV